MCGIAGHVRAAGAAGAPELALVEAMASAIAHRGPDGDGFVQLGSTTLGHRRLAIIDVAGSPQPMTSADGTHTIVFNGEILNYRELRAGLDVAWSTEGDTEVLLELLSSRGIEALADVRGQFAFALHDHRDGSLLLARDRLGILPLFHARLADGSFAFASEIKALRAVLDEDRPNLAALPAYLAQRAVPAPATLHAGIEKLRPGAWMRLGADARVEHGTWWTPLRAAGAVRPREPEAAVDELERLLELALDEALVADVPVGAYLSGGVDSTVTVALAARAAKSRELKTFAAVFPGSADDESDYAQRVSRTIGTDHHEIPVDPTAFYDELWRLSPYRDAPISETSDVAIAALARTACQHVKVVISGEGSDELFGGYPKYRYARAADLFGHLPAGVRRRGTDLGARLLASKRPKLASALRAGGARTEAERLRAWFSPYTGTELDALCRGAAPNVPAPALVGDAVSRMGLVDLGSWLSDNLLERGDRMTMASSIELRPPFLDVRVVEFALSLPSSVKVHRGVTKWPVKQLAKRFVDADIIDRPKVGFQVPVAQWFRTELRDEVRELLQSADSLCRTWLDPATIDRFVDDHVSGRADRSKQIWPLVALEIWARGAFDRARV